LGTRCSVVDTYGMHKTCYPVVNAFRNAKQTSSSCSSLSTGSALLAQFRIAVQGPPQLLIIIYTLIRYTGANKFVVILMFCAETLL